MRYRNSLAFMSLVSYSRSKSQFTGVAPIWISCSFALENGLDPKKPRRADRGEGCADSITGVFPSRGFTDLESRPHKIATNGRSRATRARIAAAVTASQPRPLCESGAPGRTVSTRFIRHTPSRVHGVKSPDVGIGTSKSSCNSLKIFTNERGRATPGRTEKDSPIACNND